MVFKAIKKALPHTGTSYYLYDYPREFGLGGLRDYFEGSQEHKRPLDELKHYAKSMGCTELHVRNGRKETVYILGAS